MGMVHITRSEPEKGFTFTELDVFEHEVKSFTSRGWQVSGGAKAAPAKEEPEAKEEDELLPPNPKKGK